MLEDEKLCVESLMYLTLPPFLECCNRNWLNVLKDLKRTKEEREFNKMVDEGEGYIKLLLDAGKNVAHLQTRLKVISRLQEKF